MLFTKFLTSALSLSPTSTAVSITGSMFGLILLTIGAPIPESSQLALIKSNFPFNSIKAESILTSFENSKITIEEFSEETDDMFFTSLTVAIDCSIGFVTVVSTFSGLAPTYVVIISAYGKSILGNKSVVIFVKEIKPNIITKITATNTVNGFFTL